MYNGSLNIKKMSKVEAQGYRGWKNQRYRCNNKNCPGYKYYGAKGIKVEYTSREFITWWLKNISLKKYKNPNCGRIDHNKNYYFGNIEIQEKSANSAETWLRKQRNSRRIQVIKNGILVKEFKNARDVERAGFCKNNNIPSYIKNNLTTRKGFSFRYCEVTLGFQ